jgi:hypothetical protein
LVLTPAPDVARAAALDPSSLSALRCRTLVEEFTFSGGFPCRALRDNGVPFEFDSVVVLVALFE